jgi:hypothetical protein
MISSVNRMRAASHHPGESEVEWQFFEQLHDHMMHHVAVHPSLAVALTTVPDALGFGGVCAEPQPARSMNVKLQQMTRISLFLFDLTNRMK